MNTQIILSGIGGQGILFASKIFSEWGRAIGLGVMGAETLGMSQRGGSVISHVKIGDFMSPMIKAGSADILYSFHEHEAYRTLGYVKAGGLCFVNLSGLDRFNKDVLDHLQKKEIKLFAFDAGSLAVKIGAKRSANIILIGYSSGTGLVPFRKDELRLVVESVSPGTVRDKNVEAFLRGVEAGQAQGRDSGPAERRPGR